MIIGTAGHIDHGKTALVKALTGVDADRLKEEKARGITIDLGFAYLPAPDGSVVGFVDVPGHEKFVHNMLAGATGIDFVLLVIAADDGVMPQTREHVAIVDLLGVERGLVAMTKADLARTVKVLEESRAKLGFKDLKPDSNVVKVSVIGVCMRSHAGVAKQMFQTLADKGINIQVISTSEIKVSVLIAADYTELALQALHTAYGLDAPG